MKPSNKEEYDEAHCPTQHSALRPSGGSVGARFRDMRLRLQLTPRRIALGIALVLAAGAVELLLQAFGVVPVSTKSEVLGAFRLRHRTYDFEGHHGTSTNLYQQRRFFDELIEKNVASVQVVPNEPTRLFYEADVEANGSCATYYYDATSRRKSRVSGCAVLDSAAEAQSWSSDHRFVALAKPVSNEAVIVELKTGKVVDVGSRLEGQSPKQWVKFGPWMPDGKTHLIGVVVLKTTETDSAPPYVHIEQDLFVMYPEMQRLEYVASSTGGFKEEDYRWQRLGGWGDWILPIALNSVVATRDDVRRKTSEELPRATTAPPIIASASRSVEVSQKRQLAPPSKWQAVVFLLLVVPIFRILLNLLRNRPALNSRIERGMFYVCVGLVILFFLVDAVATYIK